MTTPNLQLAEPPDFASPIALEERQSARALDALGPGWIAILSQAVTAPPADAPQGARYIVPDGASGVWTGHARHIAYRTPDGWEFRAPRRAWVAAVLDEADPFKLYSYTGTEWIGLPANVLEGGGADASEVSFQGYGLPGDPLTVEDALNFLYAAEIDHEARIDALEGGGGGGGGGWTLNVDEDGSSTANFTTVTGTWTTSGGYIRANNPSNSANGDQWLLKVTAPQGVAGEAVEVVFNLSAWNVADTNSRLGIVIAGALTGGTPQDQAIVMTFQWASATTATLFWLQPFTAGGSASSALTINTGQDYTLKVVKFGSQVQVYLDGVLVSSLMSAVFRGVLEAMGDGNLFVGLFAAGVDIGFKNFKQWTPSP